MRRRLLAAVLLMVFLASSVVALGPGGVALAGYLLGIPGVIWLRRRAAMVEADLVLAAVIGLPLALVSCASLGVLSDHPGLCVLIVGVFCPTIFGAIRLWRSGKKGNAIAAIVALFGFHVFVFLLLPVSCAAREAGRRSQCANNLKQIALALLNYEHQHGCFPPAYLCDKHGKPMHSWRVLLLPYVESNATYKKYNFNEPWNGPNNRLLAEYMPLGYVCPAAYKAGANRPPMTSYVVVTGANTAFPGCESRRLKEITDDKRETVLVVEVANSDIHWMEPRDPSSEDVLASRGGSCQPLSSHHDAGSNYWHYFQPGRGNVVCADNSVHCLPGRIRPEDVKAIVSISGGERVKIDDLVSEMPLVAGLRWDHIIGLPLFGVSLVALLVLALTTRRGKRQLAPEGSSPTVDAPP